MNYALIQSALKFAGDALRDISADLTRPPVPLRSGLTAEALADICDRALRSMEEPVQLQRVSLVSDGGPAFPQHGWSKDPEVLERMKQQGGMTMRDYFAGQAVSPTLVQAYGNTPENLAREAYAIADAMIRFREERSVPQPA